MCLFAYSRDFYNAKYFQWGECFKVAGVVEEESTY